MTEKNNLNQQELNSLDLIKKRMTKNNEQLLEASEKLNNERKLAFKKEELSLLSTFSLKSQLISSPADLISVNDHIITGFVVDKGMQVQLSDVFTYHKLTENGLLQEDVENSFLNNSRFIEEFVRIYRFYSQIQFKQFLKSGDDIIVVFNHSSNFSDLKSYRWSLNREKEYIYQGECSIEQVLEIIKKETHNWNEINVKSLKEKNIVLNEDSKIKYEEGKIIFTNKGKTIFSEELKQKIQSFDDMKFSLSEVNDLTMIKFAPYGEKNRYYIFDSVNVQVVRCDALEGNIVILPQNNGILFSNGYYLSKGEFKIFDDIKVSNYLKTINAPNGEDFLYVFYNAEENNYLLYSFNLVDQTLLSPIKTNGFSVSAKGEILLTKNGSQNSKDHNIQVWSSAFSSEQVYQEKQKNKTISRADKIGNNELVKAISGIKNVVSFIETKEITFEVYSNIIKMVNEILDVYHWLGAFNDLKIVDLLKSERETADLVLKEFQKVEDLKHDSKNKLIKITQSAEENFSKTLVRQNEIDYMMEMLVVMKKTTGEIAALKEERYISSEDVEALLKRAEQCYSNVNNAIAKLLNDDKTYKKFEEDLKGLRNDIDTENSYKGIVEINKKIRELTERIGMLNEEVGTLNFEDNHVFSEILEKIAFILSSVNQVSAIGKNKETKIEIEEAKVEFGAQSKLLEQTLENALLRSTTLDKTEEEYSKILSVIQSLESRFSHIGSEDFSKKIEHQKNEIISTFATHKKSLQNKLQEKINNLKNAVTVSLKTISAKSDDIFSLNELSTMFLTDGIVLRTVKMIEEIAEYGDITSSEELDGKMNQIRKKAVKRIRDDSALFENGGSILKLGQHRFAVNKKPFNVVLIQNEGKIFAHIETTKFYKEIDLGENMDDVYKYWDYDVISESSQLYRSEFLAYSILQDIRNGENGLSQAMFEEVCSKKIWKGKQYTLLNMINDYSSKLFREGYIKGVHDHDAEIIISEIQGIYEKSTDVRFDSDEKIMALILYSHLKIMREKGEKFKEKLNNGILLVERINSEVLLNKARKEMYEVLGHDLDLSLDVVEYMLRQVENSLTCSKEIDECFQGVKLTLGDFLEDFKNTFNSEIALSDKLITLNDLKALLSDYCSFAEKPLSIVDELVIMFMRKEIIGQKLNVKEFDYSVKIKGLIGNHNLINENGETILTVEDFNKRNRYHREKVLKIYDMVDQVRSDILKKEENEINLNSMTAKPLAAFVKNKLITDSYLPKFGANFAKQIGETGADKKADTMGMLLLTSPPGYGKTTLVEYIVDKLGMLFVKINCPSVGHDITSLDPNEAKSLTARKEIEKINLAFEMGDNVCLYLDDIQHTNPEFLQKFISLCDGTRTIDGVWEGKSKTYNLRGRRFCVVMAGNPYTESGEMFKIPDMLANRADTYNLGKISSDDSYAFELSYIENALTSNKITAGLMDKSANDVYLFLKQVDGIHVENDAFDNEYNESEASEIRDILKIMKRIQKTILKVNEQYIISASQEDIYRTEPAFKLQGSYRNMSKIMEKALPLMTDEEIDNLIIDHYESEAQTLTKSNEENILKFREIFNCMTQEDLDRWKYLKEEFMKGNGRDSQEFKDQILTQLGNVSKSLQKMADTKSTLLMMADNDINKN